MSDYYDAEAATVMVPVKVRYHSPTNVMYSFDPPTTDDVSEALRSNNFTQEELNEVKVLIRNSFDYVGTGNERSAYNSLRRVGIILGLW